MQFFLKNFGKSILVSLVKCKEGSINCFVKGPLGIVKVNLCQYKNNLKWVSNNFIILNNSVRNVFFRDFEKLLVGVKYGWYYGLTITGRGFNFKIISKNNSVFLRVKIGYSHFIYYKLPFNIFINLSKKKTKLIIFGLDFWVVTKLALNLRRIRSLHTYKKQGLLFFDEVINLKPGKQKQI